MEWQPIETAPKDGSSIITFEDKIVKSAYWSKFNNHWLSEYPKDEFDSCLIYPTHWIPMPDRNLGKNNLANTETPMKPLTEKQSQILQAIKEFWRAEYRPPTYRELGLLFDITVKGARDHCKALQKKGVLKENRKIIPSNMEIKFN